ncbi:RagB/SusD family nutrient uptake outer membrane protein [Maribellus maritimus]|nr:RagB/SusD family nutrient uptake outer membrane protein [Maribellus maritimus]
MKNLINIIMKFKSILIIGILLGASSCDDYLKEEAYSFLAAENFYTNADNAEAAIIGVYNGLVERNKVYERWYWDFLHLLDDQSTIHRNPLFICIDDFNIGDDHAYLEELWGGIYNVINRANVCIERIPDVDMDEAERNSLIAEARCIRASMYFILVRLWGEVPLSLSLVNTEAKANTPKASIDEIYVSIVEDLEFAEDYLPQTRVSSEYGRVTKGAAKALFTDVLLTREEWAKAAAKAKEIIDSGNYSLLSNFQDIFSLDNEINSEIIYPIVVDGINYCNWFASFAHAGGTENANCANGAQVWQVDEQSDIWLNWSDNDPRKAYTVYEEYLKRDGTIGNVRETSRPYPAYGKWNAPDEKGVGYSPNNPIIYRYADILLMYAEALSQANNGPNQEAYNAFNMVRRRGYAQPVNEISEFDLQTGLDASSFRDSVIRERSYEFVIEGKRLFDLMRIGKFPQILKDMGKDVRPNARFLPIPAAEIEANNSLTIDDQNEGY